MEGQTEDKRRTGMNLWKTILHLGDAPVKVKWIVPWMIVLSVGLYIVYRGVAAANDRALAEKTAQEELRAYQACLIRVEGRADNRAMWDDFFDQLEIIYPGTEIVDAILRPALERNLPAISSEECIPPGEDQPPQGGD